MTTDPATLAAWRSALAEDPVGQDLLDLTGYGEEETPWRFDTVARNLAQVAHRLLVLGAGGGEYLEAYADVLPEDTVVTELGAASTASTRARLSPLGVSVVEVDTSAPGTTLPFAPSRFDLVLARHAEFDAEDVRRVLTPGGTFATQQSGGDDMHEILTVFGLPAPRPDLSLEIVERELTHAGLRVERSDAHRGRAVFTNMGDLLRFLRRTPWLAPADLDVDRHLPALEELAERMSHGPLEVSVSRYWVLARAPEPPTSPVTDFSQLLDDVPEVPQV